MLISILKWKWNIVQLNLKIITKNQKYFNIKLNIDNNDKDDNWEEPFGDDNRCAFNISIRTCINGNPGEWHCQFSQN